MKHWKRLLGRESSIIFCTGAGYSACSHLHRHQFRGCHGHRQSHGVTVTFIGISGQQKSMCCSAWAGGWPQNCRATQNGTRSRVATFSPQKQTQEVVWGELWWVQGTGRWDKVFSQPVLAGSSGFLRITRNPEIPQPAHGPWH